MPFMRTEAGNKEEANAYPNIGDHHIAPDLNGISFVGSEANIPLAKVGVGRRTDLVASRPAS